MNTRRHNRTFTFIIGLLFTGICIATHAQELAVLSTVGQAPATVVAVSGETVITATQTTFNTYVLTAEGKPIHLATATCQGPVLDLIIADGFAYTAEASFGLGVYDIRHPETPHLVAHLQPSTKWSSDPIYTVNCLALSGNTLVLGARSTDEFIWTIDVSDPTNPVELAAVYTNRNARCLFVRSTTLYVATDDRVALYDISNPSSPSYLEDIDATFGESYPQEVRSMCALGDRLFLTGGDGARLIQMDISTPQSPSLLSSYLFSDAYLNDTSGICAFGDYLFSAEGASGFFVRDIRNPVRTPVLTGIASRDYATSVTTNGQFVLLADSAGGLVVLNIPELPDIHQVFQADLEGDAMALDVENQLAAVLTSTNMVCLFDVSTPQSPVQKGTYAAGQWTHDIQVHGQLAFVTQGEDELLLVLDISDPDNPTLAGQYHPVSDDGHDSLEVFTVAVSGDIAVLTTTQYETRNEVHILDISDPANPTLLGRYIRLMPSGSTVMARPGIVGNYILLPNGIDGLDIIDISDPATPVLANRLTTYDFYKFVWLDGDRAVITDGFTGTAYILDIQDPVHPVELGQISSLTGIYSGFLKGDQLTLSIYPNTIAWYDISQPGDPVLVGTYGVFSESIYGYENCFLAAGDGGFQVLHKGTWETLAQIGVHDQSVMGHDVVVDGDMAVMASGKEGLTVTSILNPDLPVVLAQLPASSDALGVGKAGNVAVLAGSEGRVSFIDVSTPTRPTLLGQLPFFDFYAPKPPCRVATRGGLAAVMSGQSLEIFDTAAPGQPASIGSLENFTYAASGLTWAGDHIYVACQSQGIRIVNMSNPADPYVESTSSPVPSYPVDVRVDGQTLYVSNDSGGLLAMDLADPIHPTVLDQESIGLPARFCLSGNRAVAMNSSLTAFSQFDISDPADLTFIEYQEEPSVLYERSSQKTGGISSNQETGVATLGAIHKLVTFSNTTSVDQRYWIPHIDWSTWWESYLVVDNTGDADATIEIHPYQDSGMLGESVWTVHAGEQESIPLENGACGFVRTGAADTNVRFREVFVSREGGICEFELHRSASPEISLSFPDPLFDSLTWRGLAIMNVESVAANATMVAVSTDGIVLAQTTVEIPGNDRIVGYLQDFFPGVDSTLVARVDVTAPVHMTGIRISGHNNEQLLFTPAISHYQATSGRYYITHIATEWDYWDNNLFVDNRGGAAVSAILTLYDEAGVPMTATVEVPAGRVVTIDLNTYADSNPVCGYLDIDADAVTVRQTYRYRSENGIAEFILNPGCSDTLDFLFPGYANAELTWQGIALQNLASEASQVQFQAYGTEGLLGETTRELGPHGRIAITLEDLFPELSGILRVTALGTAPCSGLNISGMGHERLLFVPAVLK